MKTTTRIIIDGLYVKYGISMKWMANAIGISYSSLQKYATKEKEAPIYILLAILQVCYIDDDDKERLLKLIYNMQSR